MYRKMEFYWADTDAVSNRWTLCVSRSWFRCSYSERGWKWTWDVLVSIWRAFSVKTRECGVLSFKLHKMLHYAAKLTCRSISQKISGSFFLWFRDVHVQKLMSMWDIGCIGDLPTVKGSINTDWSQVPFVIQVFRWVTCSCPIQQKLMFWVRNTTLWMYFICRIVAMDLPVSTLAHVNW